MYQVISTEVFQRTVVGLEEPQGGQSSQAYSKALSKGKVLKAAFKKENPWIFHVFHDGNVCDFPKTPSFLLIYCTREKERLGVGVF